MGRRLDAARRAATSCASSACSDDLTPIRQTIDEFKPTIVFNLMEAFADIGVFDQNVVSYLELLRVPYTGCNPRGLTLSRDKAPGQEAARLPPHSGAGLHGRAAQPQAVAAEAAAVSADREVADLRVVDRHLAGVGGRQRGAAARSACSSSTTRSARRRSSSSSSTAASCTSACWATSGCGCFRCGRCRSRKMPREQLAHRHRAGEVERQVPEEARHRHRARPQLPTASRAGAAPGQARLPRRSSSPATPASTCGWTPTARLFVIEANPNPQLAAGRGLRAVGASGPSSSYAELLDRIMALGLQWQPERTA